MLKRRQHESCHFLVAVRRRMKRRARARRRCAVDPTVAVGGAGSVTLSERVRIGHERPLGFGGADHGVFELLAERREVVRVSVGQPDRGAAFGERVAIYPILLKTRKNDVSLPSRSML